MARKYFRRLPNFDYVSRGNTTKTIGEYTQVKNIFKRVKIREDIFNELAYFTKYQIVGDERPDNIANKVYGDPNLDWVVMLSNNILNFENEWPMTQYSFNKYLLDKYGTYENIYSIHHYTTNEITDSQKRIIVPKGLEVPSTFSVTYYDIGLDQEVTRTDKIQVSNYDYEVALEDQKRNIYLIKSNFLALVIDDIDEIMPYAPGGSQYVSPELVRGENIRLYE